MSRMGHFDLRELRRLQERLNRVDEAEINAFLEACAKELAARLLRKVIKRTPVGDYSGDSYSCASGKQHRGHKVQGKKGGTLRRGWTTRSSGSGSSVKQYVESLTVHQYGGYFVIEIINPVEYASYVEFGHRTANHNGWVPGHFMMTISEQEIQSIAPAVLERKISKFMREHMQ